MPRRTDIKRVLVIGSGPIVIGQACEFDYSGTQACKALRAEGLEVVLVNSNPATIMTDPEVANRTYIEPLTWEVVRSVIERERPDVVEHRSDAQIHHVGRFVACQSFSLPDQVPAHLQAHEQADDAHRG